MTRLNQYTIWAPGYELRIDCTLEKAKDFMIHLRNMQPFLIGTYRLYDLKQDKTVCLIGSLL